LLSGFKQLKVKFHLVGEPDLRTLGSKRKF